MSEDQQNDPRRELSAMFEQAINKRMITMGMNDAEHREYALLQRQHKEERIQAEHNYVRTYSTRVADEVKRLQREDGSKNIDHKPSFGMDDRFNGNKLRLRAETNVRGQHKIHIASLREEQLADEDRLFERVEQRNSIKGQARKAFNRATDRRSGQDRRQRSRER